MNFFQIWFFGILFIVQLHLGFFAYRWQTICEKMLVLRYKILESPSNAHSELCSNFSNVKLSPKKEIFFDLVYQIQVKWRDVNRVWGLWCEAAEPRFPPRYYQIELYCKLGFTRSNYNLDKIAWKFKR